MPKFEFNTEMKSKLAGLLPANNDYTVTYVPTLYNDFPEEIRPSFVLKPFTQKELKNIAKIGENDEEAVKIISKHIVGWSNLYNLSTEEEITFDADDAKKLAVIQTFPTKIVINILTELIRISGC